MRIGLVTCNEPPEPDLDESLLCRALSARGVDTDVVAWDDPKVAWQSFDACVLRSTWNYYHHLEDFIVWLARVDRLTRLFNPLPIVRWNLHKKYLVDLQARGVPVIPTQLVWRGATTTLAGVLRVRGWSDVVIKPAVSAGSFRTLRASGTNLADGEQHLRQIVDSGDALVQPYQVAVEGYGERALVCIAGELSHSVRKSPRFLHENESVSTALAITDAERRLAEAALAAAGSNLLYARIDVVPDVQGAPQLMELELTEPSLFLHASDAALARFAEAIVAAARAPRRDA